MTDCKLLHEAHIHRLNEKVVHLRGVAKECERILLLHKRAWECELFKATMLE